MDIQGAGEKKKKKKKTKTLKTLNPKTLNPDMVLQTHLPGSLRSEQHQDLEGLGFRVLGFRV